MHWVKKAVFGSFFTVFIFILVSILSVGGIDILSGSFLTIGGFMLMLFFGAAETNMVFYE